MFCGEKFWKKILLFQKKFQQIFLSLTKNGWVYIVLANYIKIYKKNLQIWKMWDGRARKTGFFFFFPWPFGRFVKDGHIYSMPTLETRF